MAVSSERSLARRATIRAHGKTHTVRTILVVLKHILVIVLAVTFSLPFYWMFASALKNREQVYAFPPIWWPVPQHWNNFPDAWNAPMMDFTLYTINTVFRYAVPSTLGTLVSSVLVAYGFARIRWRGRDTLFSLCLATMMVPYVVRMVPLFIIFKRIGWASSFLPLVVPNWMGSPIFIFMLRQFFRTIPLELSDAGRIDGVGELGLLVKIVLPLCKPALAVVALFQLMWCWNDYLGPLIYANRPEQWTLALAVQQMRTEMHEIGMMEQFLYPWIMAISTIITVPILLVFFFAQRTFVEGVALTGIKG